VKLVDANVLIYAVNEDAPNHAPARRWLEAALAGAEPVGFAWVVLLAFLRLTTRPGLFARPLSVAESSDVLAFWLSSPTAVIVQPSARHLDLLRGFLLERGSAANLVNDAHLAALAIELGAEICSYDADFGRFSGVHVRSPEGR
jgi:toxin-antitoxin system PIN domain toxin